MNTPTPTAKNHNTAKKPLSVRFKGMPRGNLCYANHGKANQGIAAQCNDLDSEARRPVNSPSKRLFDDVLASVDAHTAAPTLDNYRRMRAAIRRCKADPLGLAELSAYLASIFEAHKRKNTE